MSIGTLLGLLLVLSIPSAEARADLRSTERVKYTCSNSLGRRDITLFGNGTVRLREGPWDDQTVLLAELGPEALDANLVFFTEIYDDREVQSVEFSDRPIEGRFVERCTIRLELPDRPPLVVEFGKMEIPPLQVSRWIHAAERLAELTRPMDSPERLPDGYQPQVGDLLRDADGKLFEVIGLTSDKVGVEVEDKQAPLRIFYRVADLRQVFVAVERRDHR